MTDPASERSSEKARMDNADELKEPRSERILTTREKIILLQSSKLHGSCFPPWSSPPLSSDFEQKSGQPYFVYVKNRWNTTLTVVDL